ncbi:MAG TPA: type II toxin-antitoxin system CcdA family antitoxin [Rhodocyclaceae bacterium]|nr:type II toxin-antitoxin system CcdA family antitoxin [Rhodocyclaceae bacterium]
MHTNFNHTLNEILPDEARLARPFDEKPAELWLHENRAALGSSNASVERRGLPLAKYRRF